MPRMELSRTRTRTRISSLVVTVLLAVIPAMSVAAAQAAPTINSVRSSGVTDTHAQLHADVRSVGQAIVHFVYGTDSSLAHGKRATSASPLAPFNAQAHVTVRHLRPHTTYYFKAVLIHPKGTSTSSVATFTTK